MLFNNTHVYIEEYWVDITTPGETSKNGISVR